MAKYYLGIDGGATKGSFVVYNEEKKVVLTSSVGPSNYQIRDTFLCSMQDLITSCSKILIENSKLEILGGFAGIAGNPDSPKELSRYFTSEFNKFKINVVKCEIESDAVLVLRSYFNDDESGIILISGTGSICYAQTGNEEFFRTGGFGHLVDDTGSGFYFGQQALRLALESKYHFKAKSPLEEMITAFYHKKDIDEIYKKIYEQNSKTEIASLAPLFFKSLQQGCEHCLKVYNDAVMRVCELVENNVLRLFSLGFTDTELKVVLHGSVFEHQKIFANDVSAYFKEEYQNLSFLVGEKKPETAIIKWI